MLNLFKPEEVKVSVLSHRQSISFRSLHIISKQYAWLAVGFRPWCQPSCTYTFVYQSLW